MYLFFFFFISSLLYGRLLLLHQRKQSDREREKGKELNLVRDMTDDPTLRSTKHRQQKHKLKGVKSGTRWQTWILHEHRSPRWTTAMLSGFAKHMQYGSSSGATESNKLFSIALNHQVNVTWLRKKWTIWFVRNGYPDHSRLRLRWRWESQIIMQRKNYCIFVWLFVMKKSSFFPAKGDGVRVNETMFRNRLK